MFSNNLLMAAASISAGGFEVDYSCRFNDGDSANLEKTGLSDGTSATQATFSMWFKRGDLSGVIQTLFSAKDTTSGDDANLYITTADKLELYVDEADGGTVTQWNASSYILRDPHAWYHLVFQIDTTQASAGDRYTIWLNGVDISTSFTQASTIEQNGSTPWNAPDQMKLSENANAAIRFFDGYMAQVAFLDGQVLEAASFGETDSNGVWRPVNITGLTYTGNNSFLLDFADSSDLGNDVSGNNFDFTSSGLETNDQVVDTPTTNYTTWSSITPESTVTLSDGNIRAVFASADPPVGLLASQVSPPSGKVKFEIDVVAKGGNGYIGVCLGDVDNQGSTSPAEAIIYRDDGTKYIEGSNTGYGSSWTTGAVIGCVIDYDGDTVEFFNSSGTGEGTISMAGTALSGVPLTVWVAASSTTGTYDLKCGQLGALSQTYDADAILMNTTAYPVPSLANSSEHHQVALVNHDGSSTAVTCNWDMDVNDTMVIIKNRDTAEKWYVIDSVTGYNKYSSYNTAAATGQTDANVFAVSGTTGTLGSTLLEDNYIVEFFKAGLSASRDTTNSEGSLTGADDTLIISANTTGGFSIVTWVGTAANETFGHGLDAAYEYGQFKNLTDATNTKVYHVSAGLTLSSYTNSYVPFASSSTDFNNGTGFGAAVGSVGTSADTNGSGDAQVAYLWTPISGYSYMAKYTGNLSADGPLIITGIKPATSMQHGIDSTDPSWHQRYTDASGSAGANNQATKELLLDTTGAENSSFPVDIISNGIKLRTAEGQMNEEDGDFAYVVWGIPFGGHGATFGGGVSPTTAR